MNAIKAIVARPWGLFNITRELRKQRLEQIFKLRNCQTSI